MVLAGIVQLVILKKLIDLPIQRYVQTAKEGFLLALGVSLPALIWRYWVGSMRLEVLGGMVLCGLVWLIAGLSLRNKIKRRILGSLDSQ
jgi:hypothetical protein